MKINKSYKALLIMIVLAFGSFVFFNPLVSTQAATINEIQAGDTIWYNVEQFTALGDLIPVDTLTGESVTGTFVGSQIYVKVLKVGSDTVSYYDGTTVLTESIPTVDVATGAILGTDIILKVADEDGVLQDVILPSGAGLPFPMQFATTSVLNVTDFPSSVLPLPLILNDDWTMHEAVMTELATALTGVGGSVVVTNTAAEFGVDVSFVNGTDSVTFTGSWSKTDGLLQSVEVHIDAEGEVFDAKLAFQKKENIPLTLDVGDKWSISIEDIGFEYLLAGLDPATQTDISTAADQLLAQFDSLKNQVLFDLEVKEIDGLYYRVGGQMYDGDLDTMVPVPNNQWLTGFGTLNYQLSRLGFGADNIGFILNEANQQRIFSGPGFAITEDWEIYNAFDLSISAVAEGYESLIVDGLAAEANLTGVSATVDISYTGGEKNGGYEVVASTLVDATGPLEEAGVVIGQVTIHEATSGTMFYDNNGALKVLKFSGEGSIETTNGEKASITNARVTFGIVYETVNPRDAPPGDDGEGPIPGLDVPGFDMYIAILSILSLGIIIRRRKI